MEVIKKFPETMDARTAYKMMRSPEVKKMIDAEDAILEVKSWVKYTDVDSKTGEIKEILTIETADGEMFGTVSDTFKSEFDAIVEYFGDDVGSIKVVGGTSKNDRKFITCTVE